MSQEDEFEELREGYAEKQRATHMRLMRKRWAKVLPIERTIKLKWISGVPVRGQLATAEIEVGNDILEFETGDQDDPFFKRHGTHKNAAEQYALWKWHNARQTPVDERDNYVVEPGYEPPVFVWDDGKKAAKAA